MSSQDRTFRATNIIDGEVWCRCPAPTADFTSHTDANPGRRFYKCAKEREDPENCKFFKWHDDIFNADGTQKGVIKSPMKPTQTSSSQTQTSGPSFRHQAPPITPPLQAGPSASSSRFKPKQTPPDESAAKAARRAAIEAAISGGPPPDHPLSSTSSPRKLFPVIRPEDDLEDGMELDRESQMGGPTYTAKSTVNLSPSSVVSQSSRRSFSSRSQGDYTTDVVSEGSPKKRLRQLAPDESRARDRFPSGASTLSSQGNDMVESSQSSSILPSGFRTPTTGAAKTETYIVALDSLPDHLRMLERLKSSAERANRISSAKAAKLEAELEIMKREKEEYEAQCQVLQERNAVLIAKVRHLEENLQHYKTGAADYD